MNSVSVDREDRAFASLEAELSARRGEGLVAVLSASVPDPVRADDGYLRRVLQVDAALGSAMRVYVVVDQSRSGRASVEHRNDVGHVVHLADEEASSARLVRLLSEHGASFLAHSVYALASRFGGMLLKSHPERLVLDVHGAVPEELTLLGDPANARRLTGSEKLAFRRCGCVVFVSESMRSFYAGKYGRRVRDDIVLPVLSTSSTKRFERERTGPAKPRVSIVYVGGAQRWQHIAGMAELARVSARWAELKFFSSSPDELRDALRKASGDEAAATALDISRVSPHDVPGILADADYGLALRLVSPVNYVASPTKVLEYVAAGVIPVMTGAPVGDFGRDGLAFVPFDDLLAERLPTPERLDEMRTANLAVLQVVEGRTEAARLELTRWLSRARALAAN